LPDAKRDVSDPMGRHGQVRDAEHGNHDLDQSTLELWGASSTIGVTTGAPSAGVRRY